MTSKQKFTHFVFLVCVSENSFSSELRNLARFATKFPHFLHFITEEALFLFSFYDRKNRIFFIYVSSMCVVFSISTHVGNTYYYRMNMKLSQVFQFQNKKPQTCLTLFFIFMNRVQVRRTSFDKIQTMFLRFLFLSPVGERLGTT